MSHALAGQGFEPRDPVVASISAARAAGGGDVLSDTAAGLLRRLIDEAGAVSARLEAGLERARRADSSRAQASARLQERLRLGASMLKAFQTQIDRVNEAVTALREQELAAGDQQHVLETRMKAISGRLDEIDRGAGEGAVLSGDVLRRAETLRDTVDEAEKAIAVLAHRCAANALGADRRAAELQVLNHQAARAGRRLTRTLRTVTSRCQQVEDRLERLEQRLDELDR